MNEDLLSADCVINQLVGLNVIKIRTWRGSNPDDHIYDVIFDGTKEKVNAVTLQIIIRSGQYYTNRSRVTILARLHHFDPEPILTGCAT
jgi:hypothetical protein